MEPWREYQEEAAAYFRSVGLDAGTDVSVQGVRAKHDIDVVVQFDRAGMGHTWLVECKKRGRRVEMTDVLAFRSIVQDVGADRGIFLAENGFQSGAYNASEFANVTVTSLAELRAASPDEIFTVEVEHLQTRVDHAFDLIKANTRHIGRGGSIFRQVPGWKGGTTSVMGHLSLLASGIRSVRRGMLPAAYGFANDANSFLTAASRSEFLVGAHVTMQKIENALAVWEGEDWEPQSVNRGASRT
ncbi:hypothetical protein GCM10027413_24470 [Conyzicola nivalis]|uniref:Restriction endonuclease type IV Mrr domain-containing protein n=1 Tax=Conyzicola nivalis TaxID=1477021 RepID=A0A916SCY8_9MICO|nr:restriction endonuclease [Conyzicola nivalis]GGA91044.1 hypothetical protein GCM10010979_02150 [Conyzicola nivalis]